MRTRTVTAVVGAVVTGAALLAPGSAYAATRPHTETHTDATHDVTTFDDSASTPTVVPAPTRDRGDVLSLTSTHAAHAVRMSVRLGDLVKVQPGPDSGAAYGFAVRSSAGRNYVAVIEVADSSGTRFRTSLQRGDGRTVRCHVVGRVDAATSTVGVVVPRGCLGRPRWVRTGMGTVEGQGSTFSVDDARVTGATSRTLDRFPSLGQRLFH